MKRISKVLESKKKFNIKKIEFHGYEILYGKDAVSNDYLTFEIGKDEDLWLHCSSYAGSHVVIKGENPPKYVIEEASKIAKEYSKGKDQKVVKVVYCKRKYVTKKDNMNPGQVSVNYKNSNFIEL